MRGSRVSEILDARMARADPPVSEYTEGLVEGVVEHWREINERISEHAEGWTLERMPPVDRNILRIAVLELGWRPDVPPRVVIDEAVELAKSLSTERSPGFVNGLLGSLVDVNGAATPGPTGSEPGAVAVEAGAPGVTGGTGVTEAAPAAQAGPATTAPAETEPNRAR
ncbi:transcription antitermination factor NusB [Frankia sp. AgB32]|nr:transcription antitermination factor NusB [Frankia sp. AgB32]